MRSICDRLSASNSAWPSVGRADAHAVDQDTVLLVPVPRTK
jgi:hypothetical protein